MNAQQHYEECLKNGCSPRLAEMLALRTPPQSSSEREFLAARENGRQFEKTPRVGDIYRKIASEAGVSTTGKVYEPQLADFPGDPKAWFSDRGEIKKRCEELGAGCHGIVPVKPRQHEPAKPVDVADDIVESVLMSDIEKNPDLLHKPLKEAKAAIRDRIKPKDK